MIKFYYSRSPNPMKVALCLEETGLPYEPIAIDTRKGQQFTPEFLAINPNAKVPALTDGDATLFDSNAILLYLAEKTGRFLPGDTLAARAELLSWLMFVATGIGPYSGQAIHFRLYAPQPAEYANTRYQFEAKRHYDILEARLAHRQYMLGSIYTIVDMALWGWVRLLERIMGDGAWAQFPNLKRHCDEVTARPAAQRALDLQNRHAFKTETDSEALRNMFRYVVS
ncbi:MAG TPA: glutathione S-transferase N-terminal domain-containing protein [Pseudolabrys sp.]|nr:glutathione S-transferase N-terminal domain-containing protein [Pseudolabrys sp.]